MDLKEVLSQGQTQLLLKDDNGIVLKVKETSHFRWFEYGGSSIQTLMNKNIPEQILLPVTQALLLFLLFKNRDIKVLNLGIGGASIDRALATIPNISLTSVDSSNTIIEMAKRYFSLPKNSQVICQKAEQFIEQTTSMFDVVLCDLFIDKKSPEFLFIDNFYFQLSKKTTNNSVVMINLQADTDKQLLKALLAIKKQFPYIALLEFKDYSNIVIIASSGEIPNKEALQQRLVNFTLIDFSCFLNTSLEETIQNIRYIPLSKSK